MTPEQKVTSRELSEKLRDAGAKQESEYCWAKGDADHPEEYLVPVNGAVDSCRHNWFIASSFDCHELLESLPHPVKIETLESGGFRVENWWLDEVIVGRPLTEVLGKLKLWLLENGYIK